VSSEKKPKQWKILSARLIQKVNGFKQEIAMAVFQDDLSLINGESILVQEVTTSDSRKDAYIAMLEERAELLRVALEFYSNNKKVSWWIKGGDKYGVTDNFDWNGEIQDEPYEVAEKALNQCAQIRARFEESGKV
jgi:flagellar hook assembly protein FlgD